MSSTLLDTGDYMISVHHIIRNWQNLDPTSAGVFVAKSFAQYMLEVSRPNSGQYLWKDDQIDTDLWRKLGQPSFSVCVPADRGLSCHPIKPKFSWTNRFDRNLQFRCDTNMLISMGNWIAEAYTQVLSETPVL